MAHTDTRRAGCNVFRNRMLKIIEEERRAVLAEAERNKTSNKVLARDLFMKAQAYKHVQQLVLKIKCE